MKKLSLFLLFFGQMVVVHAQAELSLSDAVRIGLEKNYSIRIAQNDRMIADNNHSLGNAGFMPAVTAQFDQNNANNDTRQEFLSGQRLQRDNAKSDNTTAAVGLTWTIFDGLKMFTTYEKLGELKKLGEADAKVRIEATIATIIQSYAQLVQAKQQLLVADKNVAISEERLALAEQRFRLGSGSKLEVLNAKVDLNADKSARLTQNQLSEEARINLNELLGRSASTALSPTDSLQAGTTLQIEQLRNDALKQNPALLIAESNRRIAKLELKEVQSAMLPRVDLLGDYHWNRSNSEAGFLASNQNSGINYGLRASINLFNGFQVQRERQNARIRIETANMQLEQERLALEAGLNKVYLLYANALQMLALEQENLEVAAQNLDVANERFKLGAQTALELREAQRQYIAAETRLIQARYLVMVSRTELLRLSGKLLS
jgi:outer membrane protein TolC